MSQKATADIVSSQPSRLHLPRNNREIILITLVRVAYRESGYVHGEVITFLIQQSLCVLFEEYENIDDSKQSF